MRKKEIIMSNIEKMVNIDRVKYYSSEEFYTDALIYIKALEKGRMICNIDTVSRSGMSRTLKFVSCEKNKGGGCYYRNYWRFFKVMDYQEIKNSDYFRIAGCGMDMVFNTNYDIIYLLQKIGFMSKKQCNKLCQISIGVI